jgi:hypothetical protein
MAEDGDATDGCSGSRHGQIWLAAKQRPHILLHVQKAVADFAGSFLVHYFRRSVLERR